MPDDLFEEPDNRYVTVLWSDSSPDHPELIRSEMSDFEAAGMLRAALMALEAYNADTIKLPDDIAAEDDD